MTDETKALTVTVQDIRVMAEAVAKSKLFGMKTTEEAMALMLIAHAEGLHPAIAARDYNIIQGKPAKSAEAMQRAFLAAGGRIEWHELTDAKASATFSHPQGGSVKIEWDLARAAKAGLAGKDNYKKWPRQMLRARVISEGTRTVWPGATSGMYTPEEVRDFDEPKGKPKAEISKPEPDPTWKGLAVKELPPEALVWMLEHGNDKQRASASAEMNRRTEIEAKAAIPTEQLESADIVDAEPITVGPVDERRILRDQEALFP